MEEQPEVLRLADDLVDYVLPCAGSEHWDTLNAAAAELRRLQAENEALRSSLKKANDQAEHFEREWYLRGDEIEKMREVNQELLSACQAMLACCYDMERNDETLAAVKATMLAIAKATGELK